MEEQKQQKCGATLQIVKTAKEMEEKAKRKAASVARRGLAWQGGARQAEAGHGKD
jgi:hypothetical protein